QEAGDGPQSGRLAGAVRADERDDLALAHLERDAAQRVDRAVVHVQLVEAQERPVHGCTRPAAICPACSRAYFSPRYASMTFGFVWISRGSPCAIVTPWSSTRIRYETPITSFMQCSLITMATPNRSRISLMSTMCATLLYLCVP